MQRAVIDRLVGEYRSAATAHNEPNDGSTAWITRVNQAAGRMVLIARELAGGGAEAVAALAQLVQSEDQHLSVWAAHHLLDFGEPNEAARTQALSVIERAAQGDGAQAYGERLWLENWRAEQQDE